MVHYFDEDNHEYTEEPVDDISDDIDTTEGNALEKIKDLKEKLKACEKERKDYLDGWQRSKADYLNSKKRFDEERREVALRTEDAFIERLLPLCDSFDMAVAHGEATAGWNQIHSQLKALLASLEVIEIGAPGEAFDPRLHEALKTEDVEDQAKDDHVTEVLQKGYMRRDRLLRPAKVIIGAFKNI